MPLGNHPYEYKGTDSIIVSRDRGSSRKHVGENNGGRTIMRYRVDGVIIRQQTACDFIVTNEETSTAYLIELKGNKVADAAVQLMATADNLKRVLGNYETLNFRIVASKCKTHQVEDTSVRKLRKRYKKAGQVIIGERMITEEI